MRNRLGFTCHLILSAAVVMSSACSHRTSPPRTATLPSDDGSYADLEPGERLRIVVPVFKSGGYRLAQDSEVSSGTTVVLSAKDLTGYAVFHYSVAARRRGKVGLTLNSAEITQEGRTVQALNPPALPFALPSKPQHVRLIYFIRNSQSDHNMAIAGAKTRILLQELTNRLKVDPSVCKTNGEIFCSWVPAGIAVRPEDPTTSN